MKSDALKVLVLCTGNSCRSVMAEALINDLGHGRYQAWSAGSVPVGVVHPKSIETLKRHGMDPGQPRSKSWDELAQQSFDLVITVCDQAAGESCPLFPGNPKKLYWSTPDPAKVTGSEAEIDTAFDQAFFLLKNRVEDVLPHLISRQPVFPCCPSISAENSGVIKDSCLRIRLSITSLILCLEIPCCLPS